MKIAEYIVKVRIPVMIGILIITVVCFFAMDKVEINYNNASYLDETTTTHKAIEIMEEEFEQTGNILMMVPDVDEEAAGEIEKDISETDNVLNVSVTLKDGDALFAILTDGDDYSDNLRNTYFELKDKYSDKEVVFGGSGIDNLNLQEKLTSEIVYILGISVLIVLLILFLTATSFVEPFVFLFAAGIGIIINRGTNLFYGDISYITNAVSAILQLALSMDYSIMLLHRFHEGREKIADVSQAMVYAMKNTISPVACSALTTMAGLSALVFMNFKIGFDIGTVLIKGVFISAVLVFTLLPGLLILFSNALEKTKKKPIRLSAKGLSNLAAKHCIPVTLIFCLLIGTAGYFSFDNKYFFSVKDTAPGTDQIVEKFGETNTIAIIYRNAESEKEEIKRQEKLREDIQGYDIKEFLSYENTALEDISIKLAEKKLGLSKDDAVSLFTIYQLYNGEINPTMTANQCISFILSDLRSEIDDTKASGLQNMLFADETVTGSYSADELYKRLKTFSNQVKKADVNNLYALYEYDENDKYKSIEIPFMTMISYMKEKGYGDKDSLKQLEDGLTKIEKTLNAKYSAEEFSQILIEQYGINEFQARGISQKICPNGKMTFKEYLYALDEMGILPEEKKNELEQYERALKISKEGYAVNDFAAALGNLSEILSGKTLDLKKDDVTKLYISYFKDNKGLGSSKHKGLDIIEYMKENNFSDSADNLLTVHKYLNSDRKYTYPKMADSLKTFTESLGYTNLDISEEKMAGVYIKKAIADGIYLDETIKAEELCSFVNDNMDSNEFLSERMSNDEKQEIREKMEDISSAEKLFKGDEYSRLIIRTGLSSEGEEPEKLVEAIKTSLDENYDKDAQIAGNLMIVYDLKSVFNHDLKTISIVTVLSIFAIILLTFMSISLPVILILIIQGAIWMSMCTSVITGNDIFFMAYVVALCVLMGATIDYAILLTNNYLNERRDLTRKDAIQNALKNTLPTIFTSGMILITAGLTVHFVATETAISTVGLLIGKGAIFSVLMVLLALPSFLVLLDKLIQKSTYTKS